MQSRRSRHPPGEPQAHVEQSKAGKIVVVGSKACDARCPDPTATAIDVPRPRRSRAHAARRTRRTPKNLKRMPGASKLAVAALAIHERSLQPPPRRAKVGAGAGPVLMAPSAQAGD